MAAALPLLGVLVAGGAAFYSGVHNSDNIFWILALSPSSWHTNIGLQQRPLKFSICISFIWGIHVFIAYDHIGESGVSPRCVRVHGCFHDCIGFREDQRIDLNGENCTGENTAGGCCKIFCGDLPCNVEITVNCTDHIGHIGPVNYTRTRCEEPTTVAPRSTTQTTTAPQRDRHLKGLFWNIAEFLGQKGFRLADVAAVVVFLLFVVGLIVRFTVYKTSFFSCSGAEIYRHPNPQWKRYLQPSSPAKKQNVQV
ncbi:uncharacterized protein ACNLHF_000151 [Anomaloglossus baeobatrachus]|uniref:uncharacterized protein LOC142251894 n=1 Tax=Anomaloglossus baeobatrachus TaxID=238106 RepID=UPI003F505955